MQRVLLSIEIVALVVLAIGLSRRRWRDRALAGGLWTPMRAAGSVNWVDQCVGLILCCAFVAVTLAGAHALGFMRDEGMYFDASKSYAGWFEQLLSRDPATRAQAFTRGSIDAHWAANGEHPSLMKSSFALSWIYFWKTWPQGLVELFSRSWLTQPLGWLVTLVAKLAPKLFIEESAAFRFPGMVTGGLALWLVYLFGAEAGGRATGIAAAALFAGLPRTFFDDHLAGFDAAATLAWLAVAYSYWRGLRSMGWAVASGVIWGGALLAKHNSWFLPFVFVMHYAYVAVDALRRRPGSPATLAARAKLLPIPWPFLFMGMLGPAVFIYGWPRLWFDTFARIEWYFSFHARHDYYNIEYLHRTYFQPPLPVSMPYVLTLATVPAATLMAMVFGVVASARALVAPIAPRPAPLDETSPVGPDARRTAFFWLLNLNLPLAIIAYPTTPHFGGTKHWHPAYPFLCLFGGLGVAWMSKQLVASLPSLRLRATRWLPATVLAPMVALVALPGFIETKRSHPHGLSHYTPLVGGPAGGATLGLNRGFWGYETGALVDWLKQHLPNGGRVYPNDTFHSSWLQLVADGRLPQNIDQEWFSLPSCDVAVIEHEQHMDEVEHQIWMAFGTVTPAYVVTLDGVPTLSVYVNPRSTRFVR